MRVSVRGDIPVVTLVFDSVIPDRDELVETVRVQTSLVHLKKMSDVLSNTIRQLGLADEDAS